MADRHIQVVEPGDNVATVLRDIEAGETVTIAVGNDEVTVDVPDSVTFGHKIAIEAIPDGETVIKYGKSIGNATEDIASGEWVHVHNVESNYGRGDLTAEQAEAES